MTARAKPMYLADLSAEDQQMLAIVRHLKLAPVEERLEAVTKFRKIGFDKATCDAFSDCLFPDQEQRR